MSSLADTYNTNYNNWKTSVNTAKGAGVDSPIVDQSEKEIAEIDATEGAGLDSDAEYKNNVKIDINGEDCNEFAGIIQNVIDLFDSYMTVGQAIKYHGANILGSQVSDKTNNGSNGINNLDLFDNVAKTCGTKTFTDSEGKSVSNKVNNDDIPVKQSELNDYKNNTWEFDGSEISNLVALNADNNPWFHEPPFSKDKDTSTRKIDKFLHRQFDSMDVTDKKKSDKTKGILDALKALVKNPLPEDWGAYKNIHNSANEVNSLSELPSKGDGGASENTGDLVDADDVKKSDDVTQETAGVKSVADTLQRLVELVEDVGLAARDDLYTTDYVMNMFSYETHYMETVYNQTRENMTDTGARQNNIYNVGLSKPIKPGNAKDLFDTQSAWNIMTNTDLTKTYNKSLTNRLINKMEGDASDGIKTSSGGEVSQTFKGNNWSYGNEVEYILSGSDNKANKDRIETVLYFIRYAFNFVPVFSEYWDDEFIVIPVAELVATATCGVIPPPLTKLILCMGICAGETAVDEDYLMAGLPVKLVKGDGELFLDFDFDDPEVLAKKITDEDSSGSIFTIGDAEVPESDISLSYSDYLGIFVFLELVGNSDNMYKRIADVIQANLSKNPNIKSYEETGFVMSKAKTYFTIDTKVKIKPMMIKIPISQDYGTGSLLNTDNWNTFTYKTVEGY